jgi:hypothetical protein
MWRWGLALIIGIGIGLGISQIGPRDPDLQEANARIRDVIEVNGAGGKPRWLGT